MKKKNSTNLRYRLLLFLVILFNVNAFAQELSGTVLGEGNPLPGASVVNLTNANGVTTDFDGNFVLTGVKEGDEIEFSYIGFDSQKIIFSGQIQLTVSLIESTTALDEVVVVGYGTQIQQNLSSSISKVNSEDLQGTALPSFEQAIQGRAAGVQVTTGSGMSGSPLENKFSHQQSRS